MWLGLKQRIEKEIKSLLPVTDFANDAQAREVRFGRFPEYIEALKDQTQEASWLGASITAKVFHFKMNSYLKMIFVDMKNFITKLDYNDIGPRVVSLKGY